MLKRKMNNRLKLILNEMYELKKKKEFVITKFAVSGLYDEKNIEINFDKKGKILVGENGSGKTTILNMFYYLISKNFEKLLDFKFNLITISFNHDDILLPKMFVQDYLNKKESYDKLINQEKEKLNLFHEEIFDELKNFSNILENKNLYDFLLNKFENYQKINKDSKFDESIKDYILSFPTTMIYYLEYIIKKINMKILYLPTYRRVDENLKSLENELDNYFHLGELSHIKPKKNPLTQFSMKNVNEKIKELEDIIDKRTQEGYINLTKNVLKSFAKNEYDEKLLNEINKNKNKIVEVLSKFENTIEKNDINEIKRIVNSKKELDVRKDLAYFISGLITIYEHTDVYERKLKDFMDKCNEYLSGKKFKYYPNEIKLKLEKENLAKTPLELDDLSSGEKQIISIFCKIYLENDEDLFIIFDEPELSLSVIWQEKILVDIFNSGKCKFLLSATHSPFIFKNELKEIVDSIEIFTTPFNNNPF